MLLMAPAFAAGTDEAATQFSEEQIKAAILVAFARTTEWPAGTFGGETEVRIGIVGRDTLGDRATAIFAAPGTAKGLPVRFRVITEDAGAARCHILFVPRSERRRGRELLDRLRDRPVLTVGESDDFLEQKGMVNLVPKQGVMKFEVNLNPTKDARLRIPSQVLGSALKVQGKYE